VVCGVSFATEKFIEEPAGVILSQNIFLDYAGSAHACSPVS
jgi:hypothetical protein